MKNMYDREPGCRYQVRYGSQEGVCSLATLTSLVGWSAMMKGGIIWYREKSRWWAGGFRPSERRYAFIMTTMRLTRVNRVGWPMKEEGRKKLSSVNQPFNRVGGVV